MSHPWMVPVWSDQSNCSCHTSRKGWLSKEQGNHQQHTSQQEPKPPCRERALKPFEGGHHIAQSLTDVHFSIVLLSLTCGPRCLCHSVFFSSWATSGPKYANIWEGECFQNALYSCHMLLKELKLRWHAGGGKLIKLLVNSYWCLHYSHLNSVCYLFCISCICSDILFDCKCIEQCKVRQLVRFWQG